MPKNKSKSDVPLLRHILTKNSIYFKMRPTRNQLFPYIEEIVEYCLSYQELKLNQNIDQMKDRLLDVLQTSGQPFTIRPKPFVEPITVAERLRVFVLRLRDFIELVADPNPMTAEVATILRDFCDADPEFGTEIYTFHSSDESSTESAKDLTLD